MSNTVTNVQIEDVLSSIRKLVSEEVRAQTRAANPEAAPQDDALGDGPSTTGLSKGPAADAPADRGEDRLLLTPALRVPPGDSRGDAADQGDDLGEEAPFTHAEPQSEEADLLDLMDRVRAADGVPTPPRGDTVQTKFPGTFEDAQGKNEQAIRAALDMLSVGALSSSVQSYGGNSSVFQDRTASTTPKASEPLSDVDSDRLLDADDSTLDLSTLENESDADLIPKFLHRNGVTSLGQRIADVEAVVTSAGGEWEPEADEDNAAVPGPSTSSLPWDDAEADHDSADAVPADGENWSVAPDPTERDFQDRPVEVASSHDRLSNDDALTLGPDDLHSDDFAEPEALAPEIPAASATPIVDEAEPVAVTDWQDDFAAEAGAAEAEDPEAQALETEAEYTPLEDPAPTARESIVRRADMQYPQSEDDFDADDRDTLTNDDPTILDEDMLRDLVSEIVRQELQGALGERITRNVRKLVRREIHRALSAQDL